MNAKEFESSFQFLGSKVNKFSQTNDFYSMTADMDLDRTIDIEYSTSSIDEKDSRFYGALTLYIKIDVKEKQRNNPKKKYKGTLEIVGFFAANREIGKETFAKMLEVNGCASLFSVARAFFISVSAQSMLDGQITLPLLNIVNMSKKKSENNQ